jgi:hypothetical protein
MPDDIFERVNRDQVARDEAKTPQTAGERIACVQEEIEKERRMSEPFTRGDALFVLDLVHDYAGGEKRYLLANVANVVRMELRDLWGIHG